MKIFKSFVTLLLVIVLLSANFTAVYASDVMPIFDHCATCELSFYVTGGLAYVTVDYCANYTTFTHMSASVKIQKRFLGIFWTTVDIGYEDNVWTAGCTDNPGLLSLHVPIEDTGVYRAVFEVKFYGTTGTVDEIDHKIECEYNV